MVIRKKEEDPRYKSSQELYLLARLTSVGSPLSAVSVSPSRSSSSESSGDEILVVCLAGTTSGFFLTLVQGIDLTDETPAELCATTTEPRILQKITPLSTIRKKTFHPESIYHNQRSFLFHYLLNNLL